MTVSVSRIFFKRPRYNRFSFTLYTYKKKTTDRKISVPVSKRYKRKPVRGRDIFIFRIVVVDVRAETQFPDAFRPFLDVITARINRRKRNRRVVRPSIIYRRV